MMDVWKFGFDQYQGAFLNTCLLGRELALFYQFVDVAVSEDGKTQDLTVAQSANDDSTSVPLQHQCELQELHATFSARQGRLAKSPRNSTLWFSKNSRTFRKKI